MIYLDFAAATYVDSRVKSAMDMFWSKEYGNPNSLHTMGLRALNALNNARACVAGVFGCSSQEVVFTGSGSESINLAVKGVYRANKHRGRHIITSAVDHPSVLESCKYLEKFEGAEVTYLPVDKFGRVSARDFEKAIRSDTILASIIYVNNEIGTINDIARLSKIARRKGVYFHSDACQASLLNIDVDSLGVDLLTMNGSKLYAPKGVGVLFVRKGVNIHPTIHGGGQEFGLRSGTQSVPLIVGFAKGLEISWSMRKRETARLTILRDRLIKGLLKIPRTILNGHPVERSANNVNVTFFDVEGESLLLHLNEFGIYASTASACSSHSLKPSHVLTAIGLPREVSHGSIRFSLGRSTTKKDIDFVLKVVPGIVEKLRLLSPVRVRYG